jgi:enoyl-CoA hydratase/carnithine racemase
MGRTLGAREAYEWGLLSDVFPQVHFQAAVKRRVGMLASMPPEAVAAAKRMIVPRDRLKEACEIECDTLMRCWTSPACMAAAAKFLQKK